VHHAPLIASLGQQFADRRDQSGAPVAGHHAHAGKPAQSGK
jgi:hypothetical protein